MKQFYTCLYRYIPLIGFWASMLIALNVESQENDLILKAQELIHSNPDEAIKIAEHLIKTNQSTQEKANTNLLLAKSYLVKGDYNQSVQFAFSDQNNSDDIRPDTQIELHLIKARLLSNIYLNKQGQEYLQLANQLITELPVNRQRDSLQILIKLEQINMHLIEHDNQNAIAAIKTLEQDYQDFFKQNKSEKRSLYFAKEQVYNNLAKYDSASVYINKTLGLINSNTSNNLYQKALIYRELGHLQLLKKEFSKSEENLFIASKFAEIIDNPVVLTKINKDLAINYLATNKTSQHKAYNDKYLALNAQIESMEQESVNSLYNMLTSQSDQRLEANNDTYKNYSYIALAGLALALLIGIYLISKSVSRKKRLREIIKYIEISRNNFINTKPKPSKKSASKGIDIPEETEQQILQKLKKFEASKKFLNKEMSLAVLAGQFETNTKYLSGVINKHYHDNFNTFINKLRINYIIDKLKNDSNYIHYKISFLAEESGYASHSSFATVFKSIIGMSPVTFIKLIQKERQGLKTEKILQ
ncbi:AraC family transcriptional regulator [Psychroserpens sp. SPM9]|uniref:helix-turn-helix domain-containing protein n=1 Tax=Psychroserpens sp. SPM9 TaxID=2975598 RepID=UPI0021A4D8D6|nr:AraC family transcriptional regulator [Psychroserpens sp. SPM9]MDG5491181.1 AraC family transcriptional regulator [Psychroserpens sp. SPM9]